MQKQIGIQAPTLNGGLADLESFQAWAEVIKRDMTQEDPSLNVVLGEIASSKQPIEEGDIFRAFQSILRKKHRTLRVLPAEKRASFAEEEAHQLQLPF